MKYSDKYGISTRYTTKVDPETGQPIGEPQFVTWNLVSQQNLLDKNCRLGNTIGNKDYQKQLCLDCQRYSYNDKVCKFARIVKSLYPTNTTDVKFVYSCMNFEPREGYNGTN